MLLGRERSVLREVGRSFEVCLDLLKVLSERGLHRQHHRLEVRDLLLLRVKGARGEPKRPAEFGVSRREKAHLKGSSCIGTPSVVPPCEAVGAWGASSSSEAAGAWGAAPVLREPRNGAKDCSAAGPVESLVSPPQAKQKIDCRIR